MRLCSSCDKAFAGQATKNHDGIIRMADAIGGDVDIDAVRSTVQDRAKTCFVRAVNRKGPGDCHRAEAARIETVNLAAFGCLRDRPGKSLTWRRATARIGIVAHA